MNERLSASTPQPSPPETQATSPVDLLNQQAEAVFAAYEQGYQKPNVTLRVRDAQDGTRTTLGFLGYVKVKDENGQPKTVVRSLQLSRIENGRTVYDYFDASTVRFWGDDRVSTHYRWSPGDEEVKRLDIVEGKEEPQGEAVDAGRVTQLHEEIESFFGIAPERPGLGSIFRAARAIGSRLLRRS